MVTVYLACFPFGERGDVIAYALCEDGTGLGSHFSSNVVFAQHDIGLTSDWHHDTYRENYPEGYQVMWVDDPDHDPLWLTAMKLNQVKYEEKLAAGEKSG